MEKALANFQFPAVCVGQRLCQEEVDYLNEKQDHDHWIIT